MGYISEMSGEMEFSRPLNYGETKRAQAALGGNWSYYRLDADEEIRETPEGELHVAIARGIELEISTGKAYEWHSRLQDLVNALPADVIVSGYFERSGEEASDLERLHVKGREVVSVKPEIVWPEP